MLQASWLRHLGMTEEKILNRGLEFALEFGPNWMQSIQFRLLKKFPDLQTDQLNKYDSICKAAMKDGHEFIYKKLETASDETRRIEEKDLSQELKLFLHISMHGLTQRIKRKF